MSEFLYETNILTRTTRYERYIFFCRDCAWVIREVSKIIYVTKKKNKSNQTKETMLVDIILMEGKKWLSIRFGFRFILITHRR